MKYQEFIRRLMMLGGFDSEEQAMKLVGATAETLCERLPDGQTECMAAGLPPEVGKLFEEKQAKSGEEFSIDEFMERVSRRAGEPIGKSVRHVRAVAEVIQEAVPAEVMNEVYATLPYDIRQLFDAGPPLDESRSGLG